MKRLSIRLTDFQEKELEKLSEKTGVTKQGLIGLAITEWLQTRELQITREAIQQSR